MSAVLRTGALALALALVACGQSAEKPNGAPADKPADKPAASASAAAAPTEPAAPARTKEQPETTIADGELPTPEDFEDEASKKIDLDNLESELAAIESELSSI